MSRTKPKTLKLVLRATVLYTLGIKPASSLESLQRACNSISLSEWSIDCRHSLSLLKAPTPLSHDRTKMQLLEMSRFETKISTKIYCNASLDNLG